MLNYIFNEVLSGTVDGVNKVFTTLHNIESIEEVYYEGSSYRDISFTGNTVTFADAPLLGTDSPTIDYFREDLSPPTPTGDVTFGFIIDDVYEKLGQSRTSLSYPQTQVKKLINTGYARIKNLRSSRDFTLRYTFNAAKTLTAIGYNPSYVEVGVKNYIPLSGAFLLRDAALVEYSTYISGRLNGAPGFVYKNGDFISIGYKIPSSVKKVSEIIINGTPLDYVDEREFTISNNLCYTISNLANGDRYIFLPHTNKENLVTVKYIPVNELYVNDSDIVGIEYEYFDMLSYYALYKLLQIREDDRANYMEKEYKETLKDYRAYKARQAEGINNTLRSDVLSNF